MDKRTPIYRGPQRTGATPSIDDGDGGDHPFSILSRGAKGAWALELGTTRIARGRNSVGVLFPTQGLLKSKLADKAVPMFYSPRSHLVSFAFVFRLGHASQNVTE